MDVSLHRFAGITAVLVLAACSGGGRNDSARTADTGVAVSSTPAPSESAATTPAAPASSESTADTSKRVPAESAGSTASRSTSDSGKGDSAKTGATAQRAHHARPAHPATKPAPGDTARAAQRGAVVAPTAAAKAGAADTDTSKTAKQPTAQAAPSAQAPSTADAVGELHDKYHPAPLDTLTQDAYQGWKQFELNCSRCHGEYAVGSSFAPALVVSLKEGGTIPTKEAFIATVCAGRPAKGMPAWCSLGLGMDKINEIYAYVKGRADGKIHAGRPALRE